MIALSLLLYMPLPGILDAAPNLSVCFICWPLATAAGFLFWSAGLAAIQELVLPKMTATALVFSSVFNTMIRVALRPYVSGKVAATTDSIRAGMFSLYLLIPLLWQASRRLALAEATRAERAGEPA